MATAPLAIRAAGMVTGVGLDWASSCAAIRAGLNNFGETRFIAKGGDWIVGGEVPLDEPWRGATKLAKMAAQAIGDCLAKTAELDPNETALLLCVAEGDRLGRLAELGSPLFFAIEQELGISFHRASRVLAEGRVGGAVALHQARRLIGQDGVKRALVAGVDSYLNGATLMAFDKADRLLTSRNSNGFIPGEAAAAVLVERAGAGAGGTLAVCGLGFAREIAAISAADPLNADGLVAAIRAALTEAGMDLGDLDYRNTDVSGEQYGFKEAALALSRLLRKRKEAFDLWHAADCVGEVGAAAVPVMLATTLAAMNDGYAPGPRALLHAGNDDGRRAALIVEGVPLAQAAAA